MVSNPHSRPLTRRHALRVLAAVGITGSAAVQVLAQAGRPLSLDTLRSSAVLINQGLSEERLEIAARALERNLNQFQMVRELVIDDLVEPAPIFQARR